MGFPKEPNSSTHCEEDLSVEVNGDVVHADQGCHGIVLWPWDVNFSMPSKKIEKKTHVISWKFIYRPYMVRSLSMPFSLSMGAFNVNFFV